MSRFKDIMFSKEIDPILWYDGQFWGWTACEPKCKVCQTCTGFRHFIEFFLRCNVPYRQIISVVEEATGGKLLLNKPNLSLHRQKHQIDDLVKVTFLPENSGGPLIPREFLKDVPYEAKNGQILLSKCVLPYCTCQWRKEGICDFKGACPAKNYKLADGYNLNFINDCGCQICASPFRLLFEIFSGGGDSNG